MFLNVIYLHYCHILLQYGGAVVSEQAIFECLLSHSLEVPSNELMIKRSGLTKSGLLILAEFGLTLIDTAVCLKLE